MREREERSVTDSDVKWQNHNRLTLRKKKKIISGKKIIYFKISPNVTYFITDKLKFSYCMW